MKVNQIVEAMLFASQEPITSKVIAKIIRKVSKREDAADELRFVKSPDIDKAFNELNDTYEKNSAPYVVEERVNGWSLYTRSEFGGYIRELFPEQKLTRLSAPALETLAIVAYRQPISKAAIEAVRGVSIDGVLQTLMERGLVSIGGRADLPGRPFLYETSGAFLEHFGIKNVDDLPNAAELRQVDLPKSDGKSMEEEQLPLAGVDRNENSLQENDQENKETAEEPSKE